MNGWTAMKEEVSLQTTTKKESIQKRFEQYSGPPLILEKIKIENWDNNLKKESKTANPGRNCVIMWEKYGKNTHN